ncbi:MAG: hypothetical protein ACR2MD_02790 [Aridibacter sp.]
MDAKMTADEIKKLSPRICQCGVKIPEWRFVCEDCAEKIVEKLQK